MTGAVQMEWWHLLTLIGGGVSFGLAVLGGGAKILFGQFEKRMVERFAAQEAAAAVSYRTLNESMAQHLNEERAALNKMQSLERDFLSLRADLPMQYVRREDYIRNQTIIEAKLDQIVSKVEVIQIRGNQQ